MTALDGEATLYDQIVELCEGEEPEAILLGDVFFESLEAARPAMQISMDPDSWSFDLPHLRVWTKSHVIFAEEYDTRPYIAKVERNPVKGPIGYPKRP